MAASVLKAMLEKLGPMAMMEENGERAACIAMALLEKRATEGPLAVELVEAEGVKIIVQTSVLHPVPELRRQATAVIGACLAEQQPTFLEAALQCRVPMALLRLLNEEDRRAKPKEEPEETDASPAAIDPDLPTRRVAIVALKSLMAGDGAAEKILEADPTFAPNLLKAGGNTDATNRLGALTHALSLARDGRFNATMQAAAEMNAAAAVEMLMCATCLDQEGSEAAEASDVAVQLMLALRASTPLRDELVQAEAHDKFGELLAREEPPLEAERAGRLTELCSWLAPAAA